MRQVDPRIMVEDMDGKNSVVDNSLFFSPGPEKSEDIFSLS